MPSLQDVIHTIEEAGGRRYVRLALGVLGAALLILAYDFRCYRNLSAPEAMDAAQLARNLAEGKGYTTLFVRPFSMFLLAKKSEARAGLPQAGQLSDASRVVGAHPDISNPPVYPLALAAWMKAATFHYELPREGQRQKAFWSSNGGFWRYEPDFLIAVFNQALFLIVVVLTFFWARRLFDSTIAWLSGAVLFGLNVLWRFSVSGLSTMLLLVIFLGVSWCLLLLEREGREPRRGAAFGVALALATGLLMGVGGLARYAFLWMIVPVLGFVGLFGGGKRAPRAGLVLAGFAIVVVPWVIRNSQLSGSPFGTAGYALIEDSALFPKDRLMRSLDPAVAFYLPVLEAKLIANGREILENDLFTFGGGWITAFCLAGLMVGFRNPAVRRFRHFLWWSVALLVLVQALGRTKFSDDSPRINSENLLVLLTPFVVVYGSSLFVLLLEQLAWRHRALRYGAAGVFVGLCWLPLLLALWLPPASPLADPPYRVPSIQEKAGELKETEAMMSDLPWAIAWYGRRECFWLTLNALPDPKNRLVEENFMTIHDYRRPISAVYLSPAMMNGRFVTDWFSGGDQGWGAFMLNSFLRKQPPPDFPLRNLAEEGLPEELFVR